MKYCTECDWYRVVRGDIGTFQMCHNPKTKAVTGNFHSTFEARVPDGPCGPEGVSWEPIKSYPRPTWWQRLWGSYDDNGRKL